MALYNTLTLEQLPASFIFHLSTDNPICYPSWDRISETELSKTVNDWTGVWNIMVEFFGNEAEALLPFIQSIHRYQDIAIFSNWFYAFYYQSYIIAEDGSVGAVINDEFQDSTAQIRTDLKLMDKEEFADFILDEGIIWKIPELCQYMDNPPLVPTEADGSIYILSGESAGLEGNVIGAGW